MIANFYHVPIQRGWGTGGPALPPNPGKSQGAKGFLRKSVSTSNWTPWVKGVCTMQTPLDPRGPIASQGRFVWPSVKYVDDFKKTKKKKQHPDSLFWICPCQRLIDLCLLASSTDWLYKPLQFLPQAQKSSLELGNVVPVKNEYLF